MYFFVFSTANPPMAAGHLSPKKVAFVKQGESVLFDHQNKVVAKYFHITQVFSTRKRCKLLSTKPKRFLLATTPVSSWPAARRYGLTHWLTSRGNPRAAKPSTLLGLTSHGIRAMETSAEKKKTEPCKSVLERTIQPFKLLKLSR